jgi:hypothetical protein
VHEATSIRGALVASMSSAANGTHASWTRAGLVLARIGAVAVGALVGRDLFIVAWRTDSITALGSGSKVLLVGLRLGRVVAVRVVGVARRRRRAVAHRRQVGKRGHLTDRALVSRTTRFMVSAIRFEMRSHRLGLVTLRSRRWQRSNLRAASTEDIWTAGNLPRMEEAFFRVVLTNVANHGPMGKLVVASETGHGALVGSGQSRKGMSLAVQSTVEITETLPLLGWGGVHVPVMRSPVVERLTGTTSHGDGFGSKSHTHRLRSLVGSGASGLALGISLWSGLFTSVTAYIGKDLNIGDLVQNTRVNLLFELSDYHLDLLSSIATTTFLQQPLWNGGSVDDCSIYVVVIFVIVVVSSLLS